MQLVNNAIWAVERGLVGETSLARVAAACGVSESRLAHAFSEATGQTVIAYARARRLSLAAEALARGSSDILSVAADAGYASHEAFSRAFKSAFGTTPEQVRAAATTDGLALTPALPFRPVSPGGAIAPVRFERLPARIAVGHVERRAHGAVATIPLQWARFMQRYDEIDAVADPIPWGVSFGDATGFDYACAVHVSRAVHIPSGMRRLDLPACDYAVFRHAEHVSRISMTYAAIYASYPNQGPPSGPVLERHSSVFDTKTGLGGVEIYMPAPQG